MSFEEQRVYLSGKVTDLGLSIPVEMPNTPFKQPTNSAYAQFHILGTKPFIVGGEGEGKARFRHVGMVQLTVWIPEGKGTKGATEAADKFADLFQMKQGRDRVGCTYRFKVAEVQNPQVKQGWDVTVVRIPFTRDEVGTVQVSL